ncbi:hypothetical protein T10_6901 [Trichinella papuae]|uniref:Uncharacterized protein n=1 Tax=Trichinella papuae TaxID=268474 RepID=A0A0V1N364_9BILA|nr:hypothetical protein T10_6901 [Trichinella papuae]
MEVETHGNVYMFRKQLRRCEENAHNSVIQEKLDKLDAFYEEILELQVQLEEEHSIEERADEVERWRVLDVRMPKVYESFALLSVKEENRRLSELELPHFSRDMVEFTGFWEQFSGSLDKRTYFDSAIHICAAKTALRKDPLNRKCRDLLQRQEKWRGSQKLSLSGWLQLSGREDCQISVSSTTAALQATVKSGSPFCVEDHGALLRLAL